MVRSRTLIVFICLFAAFAAAQNSLPADTIKKIDDIVLKARQEQKLPAVTVAIALKGKIIFSKAYGMADLENDVEATPETLIRTGSIAKPMTAVGALQLAEAGKLDLEVLSGVSGKKVANHHAAVAGASVGYSRL